MSAGLEPGADGRPRCWWAVGDPLYESYHDEEWGRGVVDDHRLFEKIVLEGFQAGLAWITILRKRERFRAVFAGFHPTVVAAFDESDVERLVGDAGIIRHRGKIESAISNASRALEMIEEHGSIAAYVWQWGSGNAAAPRSPSDVPAATDASTALGKNLKRRGWRFVGPTTVYAFMQAMGLVNDHLAGCWVRKDCEESRSAALERFGG